MRKIEVSKQGEICTVEIDGMLQTFLSPSECEATLKSLGYEPIFKEVSAGPSTADSISLSQEEVEARLQALSSKEKKPKSSAASSSSEDGSLLKEALAYRESLELALRYASKKAQRELAIKLEAIEELLERCQRKSQVD